MQAMLTLVFVFMLLNLTSIWKVPTLSTCGRGRDGVPRIVGPRARFFIRGHAQKMAPGTIPQWEKPPETILSHAEPDSPTSSLPSQSDRSPPYPIGLNLACIVQRDVPSPHAITDPV